MTSQVEFPFLKLPPEIRWAVLQQCDTLTLNSLLVVSRDTNALVKQVTAEKLRYLLGSSEFYDCSTNLETENRRLIGISYSLVEDESDKHLLEFNYVGSNDLLEFDDIPDSAYSSCPASTIHSAACSDNDSDTEYEEFEPMEIPDISIETRTSDLNPKSRFAVTSTDESTGECCAVLDIGESDYYGQVILRLGLGLSRYGKPPIWMMELSQRIDSGWSNEESYVVRNKAVTYRVQVQKCSREPILNEFGELVHRYKVNISEIVFNSGYLLTKIERAADILSVY